MRNNTWHSAIVNANKNKCKHFKHHLHAMSQRHCMLRYFDEAVIKIQTRAKGRCIVKPQLLVEHIYKQQRYILEDNQTFYRFWLIEEKMQTFSNNRFIFRKKNAPFVDRKHVFKFYQSCCQNRTIRKVTVVTVNLILTCAARSRTPIKNDVVKYIYKMYCEPFFIYQILFCYQEIKE